MVDVVFLDFSKAFDVVSHSIVLSKLQMLGIGGKLLVWIREFLIGQYMWVRVAGEFSSCREAVSGVPQGSVLGSILFLIYVISIISSVNCNWKALADDFKL